MTEENSIFIKTFGDYPALRLIDFLIESSMFDYPITEIANNSNVHFATFKKIWPRFVKNKFVVKTRTLGRSDLYKVNEQNPVIKKLIELDTFLCKQQAQDARKQKAVLRIGK